MSARRYIIYRLVYFLEKYRLGVYMIAQLSRLADILLCEGDNQLRSSFCS